MHCPIGLFLIFFITGTILGCSNSKETGRAEINENDEIKKTNVFLIYVDDLKPILGAYGNTLVHSPNMDALAADALVFNKAFATVPTCGPSRASMLTGMMPTRKRFYRNLDQGNAQTEVPEALALPGFFKQQGYRTLSLGKIYHSASDNEQNWSEKPFRGFKTNNKDYVLKENIELALANPKARSVAYEIADTTDNAYLDGRLPAEALKKLKESMKSDSALFMAVGFLKPHLPFNAPKKYWDMYDPNEIPFPTNYTAPEKSPSESLHEFNELRTYTDIPNDDEPLDSALVTHLIHGYYAATSYVDAQVGKFIQGLKDEGIYDESIIVLLGDHGWFLGEHAMWCKHANYTEALRTALMIKFPNSGRKGVSDLPVSLVEIYPTLVDMLGKEAPSHLQAQSILPQLEEEKGGVQSKEVFARWKNGYTLIKGSYAYTEFSDSSDKMISRMLYDHSVDPNENVNIVDKVKPSIIQELSASLEHHMTSY
ncbi:MAG: sulfatase [Cyclobacteriaceae bacterium]